MNTLWLIHLGNSDCTLLKVCMCICTILIGIPQISLSWILWIVWATNFRFCLWILLVPGCTLFSQLTDTYSFCSPLSQSHIFILKSYQWSDILFLSLLIVTALMMNIFNQSVVVNTKHGGSPLYEPYCNVKSREAVDDLFYINYTHDSWYCK